MPPKRVSSKVKNRQLQTKVLQDQTKKMEEKLIQLRQQVQQQKKLKETTKQQSTINRWRKATGSNVPLRDYAKKILNDRKQAFNKYGVDQKKITGAKSFDPVLTKIKSERIQAQGKNPTKLPFYDPNQNKNSQIQNKDNNRHVGGGVLPVQSLVNNFFKAKITQSQAIKRKSLYQFLEDNYLLQYLHLLQQNGINQVDDLYMTKRQKLAELGIKSGHQVKMIKRAREQIQGKKDNQEQNSKIQTTTDCKVSFGYGEGDVNEYQQISKKQQLQKAQLKDNKYSNQKQLEKDYDDDNQSNQDGQDYSEQYQDQVMITVPFGQQTFVQAQDGSVQQIQQSFICFQCYHKSTIKNFTSDGRQFCSQNCINKYLKLMQKQCPECGIEFYKFEGIHEQGLWFCSIKCAPNREDIEQMFLNWRQQQH